MSTKLQGKNALITGAGKGIGRAIAEQLASEGVNLGLISRTSADLESLAGSIREKYNVKASVAIADVGDRKQVETAVNQISHELGNIDILINNAGTAKFGTVIDMDVEEWEQMIRVNLLGTYYVTRAVLPGMMDQNYGDIINVSSTAGERGAATTSAYSASKFGVMGFSESLMQEVRKNNIRVVALAPSTVNTDLAKAAGLKIGDEDRQMQPSDIAELVLSILSLPQRVVVKNASIIMTNPQ
ncbi:3-ketoacyl-ACP reductase [Alicyclobacillus dauci]|uniref:3-ketoacyl-ACP reductase n=1 Tax=Alicyclobacillus dauci TaxID=1475485 RepID=A0ABY6Z8A5_9BACL|nr:3-ketoacyl-ACP reductase [Alicyclobacillus dauci]WAH38270.1 3-ketoacyl-ACP reductase [Alicyclobacillus dauci]